MLINEFLEHSAKNFPDKVALVCGGEKHRFLEIENMANSFAHALISKGLQRQDKVAIYLDNSVESVVAIFGILKAGSVFVVINPQVKTKKLEYILNDCKVKALITDTKHLLGAAGILDNCPSLKTILIIDYESANMQKFLHNTQYAIRNTEISSFCETLKDYPSTKPAVRCIDIDIASLIYTSGSTGNPKGVVFTHLNMVSAANSVIEYLENTSEDIIINCLPLSFGYGLYQILMAFKFGGTVVLEKYFIYPYQVINLIAKEKVTGFPQVPAIAAILLQLNDLSKFDFSSLRYITNAGQAIVPKHIFKLQELLPHVKIYSMYGLTECKRVCYLPPEELKKKPTSVGKAIPNTETYIVNERGEKIIRPGEIGELVVRGANVMKGYWNLPEETAKKLRPGIYPDEKVLYTGDLFKMDEEGYLYFISRKDDIIKTAGEMVSPREVENVLYQIDDVMEAAVVGIPDDILGNVIKAVVALRKGSKLTDKDIIFHCSKNLENFMVPKYVEIREHLPKTATGKILKRELVDS